jgi:nickel/cobalt exporter
VRRLSLVILGTLGVVLGGGAGPADAHPLGNFSVNHLVTVKASADRVQLAYVLDQAEIPTFQERDRSAAENLAAKRDEVRRGLTIRVDGRPAPLRFAGPGRLSLRPGAGGLPTTRVELSLTAPVHAAHRIRVRDLTFKGRVGYAAIVAAPGAGTAVRSTVPSQDPTGGLRRYPSSALSAPTSVHSAVLAVRPGDGTLSAPRAAGGGDIVTRDQGSDRGFSRLFEDAAAGRGVLLFLLLAAFGWGALHALSPGHGKAMVAAYLVGTRGTARHALALGGVVTLTHTIGVFALGFVTLALSQYVLPEDLYPWLNLTAGLMVVVIGAGVLRSRFRHAREHRRGHSHSHGHDHHHGPDEITWRGLLGMGASAGLIPCPSALVVLLGAIAQHQLVLGLGLIVAFSFGLAATLCVLGLLVVGAGRLTTRISVPGWATTALPAVSALVIVGAGLALTAQAIPKVV